MPTYVTGNMWSVYHNTDLFCITTNSYLRKNGRLAMGRGIAYQATVEVPSIDMALGMLIEGTSGHLGVYGLLVWSNVTQRIGAFQVKRHFKNPADLDIIRRSVSDLTKLVINYNLSRVDLNWPGIGYGQRTVEEVRPIIEALPDNVHVWTYEKVEEAQANGE